VKQHALITAAVISSILLSNARAADLVLYNSFGEVRDAVNLTGSRFDWTPPADLSQFLVAGSLELEYPGIVSQTLLPPSPSLLAAFEGREVLVKRPGSDTLTKAKVTRADIALFESNGQFFTADPSTVVYPSLEGVRFAPTYAWRFTGAGGPASLTYLTRALSWTPRYTLNVGADKVDLESWADVRNQSNLVYQAPSLGLIAGQVNLIAGEEDGVQRPSPAPVAFSKAADSGVANVQATGESAGLQTFKYPSPATLPARSTTTVPFLQTRVTLDRVLEYVSGWNPTARQVLPLNRLYVLKAESDLPAGLITVREEGRVVGQARVDDSPRAEGARFGLGADFDLRLTRTVQALERTKTTARFKVAFSLSNTKNREVTIRLREILGQGWTLEQTIMPNLKKDTEGVNAEARLAPGARLEASYTVLFKYQ
jgi:hypothetical protein